MIDILIPTFGRPNSAQRVVDNIHAATETAHDITFVVEKYRQADYDACKAAGARVLWNRYEPGYSNSIQTAYEQTNNPYLLAANDDFEFTEGWDSQALNAMGDGVMVVGIDDGSPHNEYKTIALVDRRYIEDMSGVIDIPNRVFYPYQHNYVDTEFYFTAAARHVFAVAQDAVIRHRHPDWGYAREDSTYAKSKGTLAKDGHTFNERSHLWNDLILG